MRSPLERLGEAGRQHLEAIEVRRGVAAVQLREVSGRLGEDQVGQQVQVELVLAAVRRHRCGLAVPEEPVADLVGVTGRPR